jgi:hypothetical protein
MTKGVAPECSGRPEQVSQNAPLDQTFVLAITYLTNQDGRLEGFASYFLGVFADWAILFPVDAEWAFCD